MNVEQKYKDLGINVGYNDFNRVFEIEAIELDKAGVFSKALLRTVVNKLRGYLNYVDPLVNSMPHTFYAMVVFKTVDDENKKKAEKLYKQIMDLYHTALIVETKSDEEIVKFVESIWNDWNDLEKGVMDILEVCRLVWITEKKKEEKKSSSEYLG